MFRDMIVSCVGWPTASTAAFAQAAADVADITAFLKQFDAAGKKK